MREGKTKPQSLVQAGEAPDRAPGSGCGIWKAVQEGAFFGLCGVSEAGLSGRHAFAF